MLPLPLSLVHVPTSANGRGSWNMISREEGEWAYLFRVVTERTTQPSLSIFHPISDTMVFKFFVRMQQHLLTIIFVLITEAAK